MHPSHGSFTLFVSSGISLITDLLRELLDEPIKPIDRPDNRLEPILAHLKIPRTQCDLLMLAQPYTHMPSASRRYVAHDSLSSSWVSTSPANRGTHDNDLRKGLPHSVGQASKPNFKSLQQL